MPHESRIVRSTYFQKFNKEDVRKRLIQAFLESGLSQSLLAKRVGITQAQVSYIVKSKSYPRETTLQRLSLGIGVSYKWVLLGEERMKFYFEDYPVKEFQIDFPNKLIYLIWSNGYDLGSFGKQLNYSQTLVEYYSKAERSPSMNFISRVSKQFELNSEWLLKEEY